MGRALSQWNGRVTSVDWSPWFGHKVPSLVMQVMAAPGTPPSQVGRVIHCAVTPEKARLLAAELLRYADMAEVPPMKQL